MYILFSNMPFVILTKGICTFFLNKKTPIIFCVFSGKYLERCFCFPSLSCPSFLLVCHTVFIKDSVNSIPAFNSYILLGEKDVTVITYSNRDTRSPEGPCCVGRIGIMDQLSHNVRSLFHIIFLCSDLSQSGQILAN